MTFEAFYLPTSAGQRFCLFHPADDSAVQHGAVVYVHPFAEEMNKSRRMASLQAKAMASSGYSVLQIDLHGCGDSSGDFGDATWEAWIEDVMQACYWLKKRSSSPLWLWGLRTGCLLAGEVADRIGQSSNLLLWQPVVSGKQFLQQFLRLKIAGGIQSGESKGQMERMRAQLAQGKSLEISGYQLSSELSQGLEQAELLSSVHCSRIEWIELSGNPDGSISPLARTRLDKWQAEGRNARGHLINGPAFWQTAEIAECPALIEASIQIMAEVAPR